MFSLTARRAACVAATMSILLSACSGPGPRAPRRVSLIVRGGTIITMDGDRRILPNASLAVDGDRIVAVGHAAEIATSFTARRVVDATGQIVLPGLINTHTHAPMVLYRGLADDLALMDWLQHYIFPAEARTVSPAFVRTGTRLAALEMIQSGTTLFTDMYYFEEEVARATREAGLRGVLGQTVIRFPVADAATPAEGLARAERFIRAFRGDPLVTPAVAPHAAYTLDRDTLLATRKLGLDYDVPVLIHLAETEDEVRQLEAAEGVGPTTYLDRIGFWGPRIVAAHAVWVRDAELPLLQRGRVGISHNPESNMKLASGVAPVPAYLAAGMATGLGTDGAASNNDLDMFEAMRQAAFLHKLSTKDTRVVSAPQALEMATLGGARVLGLEDRLGSLEVGKQADLIVVSTRRARQTPLYDPVSTLVYASRGDDVETTIVAGRILMERRVVQTLDEAQVLREAAAVESDVRAAVRPR